MDKDIFSPFQFNEINPDNYETLSEYTKNETISKSKEDPWFEMDECGFTDLLYKVFNQEQEQKQEQEKQVPDQEISAVDQPELTKPLNNNKPRSFSIASCQILNSYSKGFKMPITEEQNLNHEEGGTKLSTEEILRIAGERFIQFSTNKFDGISMFIHPYSSSLSGFSMEETRDVELANLLLSAAENVGSREFDLAIELITRCLWMSSNSGTPIQRLAFYFSEALQERVYREMGRVDNESRQTRKLEEQMKGLALGTNNTFLATHQQLPFVQVMQLAGIQAIIDNVKTDGNKIHVIDLQIRSGIQWTALMQGLADQPITHLKITAVGTSDQTYIEETGTRLMSFASSFNLPFSFKVVYLSNMLDFKEDLLKIELDETVVVYSYLMLRSMLSRPDCLENLMREITRSKPTLMVVTEVEANHNSPTFVDRFIETLFYYSAFFDCLDDCMESDSQSRVMLEGAYSREGILNTVASEGEERITRNVKLDVWRAFLARFGMSEIELSESSRYQACLVLKQFVHGNSCTLSYNGKGLIVGWKGTPVHSLTVWKFSQNC